MSSHKTETVSAATPASNGSPMPADLADERLVADAAGIGGMARGALARLRSGELGSLPVVIGLVVIWVVFAILKPEFLSSANLVNLTLQCAAVGTISIGIVLVLLLGEIDLSVGSVAGVSAAVLAVTFVNKGWAWPLAVLASMVVGAIIGFFYGFVYTRFGVPSFVVTLAGLLGFLGLQLWVLGKDGTINIDYNSPLVQFANGKFLPGWLSYVACVVVAGLYLFSRIRRNAQRTAAGLSVTPMPMIGLRAAALLVLLVVIMLVLNQDRGMSYMVLTFLILVVLTDLLIRRTRWGRAVMAVGGNVEAARRSGINVRRVYLTVFLLCSLFAALGGIFLACRGASAGQSTGATDVNLNAIAAAVIGGTSLFGGRGSAYSALLGILVIYSISNGLDLFSVDSYVRYMITGLVLLLSVIIDSLSRRTRAAHGRG